uniref:FAD/NAD(P)-binding domain-containing protein n=1 Tax=Caldilinea aerophila TaxID=133453 RepID=A0A7C1JC81_9CHLR
MTERFDAVVLGGGPAGLAATAYLLYARLNVALVSPDFGGKVFYPFALRDVPHQDTVWGTNLVYELAERVSNALQQHIPDTADIVRRLDDGAFRVKLSGGDELESLSVVVCTGVRAQRLFVDGEMDYWGRGLSYSAISHAPFFHGRKVAVIGGGERAMAALQILIPLAAHIDYIEARPQPVADRDKAEVILSHPRIDVFRGWEVQQIVGDDYVTGVDIVGMNGEVRRLPVEGVFVQFGLLPNNSAVRDLVELDQFGHIVVDEHCATSMPGIFAAGDVTTICAEQVPISIGEGAKAGLSAWRYVAADKL